MKGEHHEVLKKKHLDGFSRNENRKGKNYMNWK
jgi:hypothetical protein